MPIELRTPKFYSESDPKINPEDFFQHCVSSEKSLVRVTAENHPEDARQMEIENFQNFVRTVRVAARVPEEILPLLTRDGDRQQVIKREAEEAFRMRRKLEAGNSWKWAGRMRDLTEHIRRRYEETVEERAAHIGALNAGLKAESGSSLDDMLEAAKLLIAYRADTNAWVIQSDAEGQTEGSSPQLDEDGGGYQAGAEVVSEGPKPDDMDDGTRMDSVANLHS